VNKASQRNATPAARILQPVRTFARKEASGGIVLLVCAILAMALVNSPLSVPFLAVWDTDLSVGVGGTVVSKSVRFWINDGLMVIFFFVVGLEIKREVLVGELSSPRQAALPLLAAVCSASASASSTNVGGSGRVRDEGARRDRLHRSRNAQGFLEGGQRCLTALLELTQQSRACKRF